jgi:pimeloyl-ACP methyl ester carboxylesterase
MPILIFQGRHDNAVKPAVVERWAAARPNARLHLLDDDHQLGQSREFIWQEIDRFLASG